MHAIVILDELNNAVNNQAIQSLAPKCVHMLAPKCVHMLAPKRVRLSVYI